MSGKSLAAYARHFRPGWLRPVQAPRPVPDGNVDRLVAVTREVLTAVGYSFLGDRAESEIRSRISEAAAARVIAVVRERLG